MSTVIKQQCRHACARCQHPGRADQMVYSRHSGSRFCNDFDACDRRYARQPILVPLGHEQRPYDPYMDGDAA